MTITKPLSLQMTKNLLRISLFQIAFIRNLFPQESFSERTVFDDLNVRVLKPSCEKSTRLLDWIEKGVTDALFKEYLKCLRFGITSDEEGKELMEEYVFTFAYQPDGEVRMQILNSIRKSPVNELANGTVKQLKGQVSKMTRLLIALMASFDPLPDKKHIFVHLEYYQSRTPKDYEPPFFESAPALPHFEQKPFSMGLGACQTPHMCIGMKAKTTAVSDLVEEIEQEEFRGSGRSEARAEAEVEPYANAEDQSSLDTVFDHMKFSNSQPNEAMDNVAQMVAVQDSAWEWAKSKAKHADSFDDTASEFQTLALACDHSEKSDLKKGKEKLKGPKCNYSQDDDSSLCWDNIPASQPTHSHNGRRKKVSRGVLNCPAGPSKRIRMQESQ